MKHQQYKVQLFMISVLVLITTILCSSEKQKERAELSTKLQAIVDSVINVESEDPIHNAVLLVQCPKIKWKGAAGMADGKQEVMTADHKIKIASIGKMCCFTETWTK